MSKSAKVVLAVIIVLLGIALALAYSSKKISLLRPATKTTHTVVKKKPTTPTTTKKTASTKSSSSKKAVAKPVVKK